ncbi:magnesium transporter [Candidatus Saccharibacteria bacterium]|jgi:magnesium transporter|nr:magnesium transporter [Candidatus Saccharibacteria bacterium]MBP9132112.1 magnesium transporter [Candidatus Saccharibacteria bacterium]
MNQQKNLNPLDSLPLADILFVKDKRISLFLELSQVERTDLIRRVTKTVKTDILNRIPEYDLVKIIEMVDPDEATDILQILHKAKRDRVLGKLADEIKSSLSTLLEFDPKTAAGLMTLDYIQMEISDSVAAVSKKFKQHEKRTGRLPVILVMKGGSLAGYLPGHELGFANKTEGIKKYIKRMPTISYAADHQTVIDTFHTHPHGKIAVLTDDDLVVGIIYSDDVLQLIESQSGQSLYDFAGVSDEENVTDTTRKKVKFRYKWLIINLATAFLAAFTVSQFQATISKYVLLAVYMPIVAGMGGNAATQTLAVVVRGIALRQISIRTAWQTLKNEIGAGFINGLINGLLVALIVILKDRDWKIAIVLALSMVINLVIAAIFGTLVPLVMTKLKKDPASSATIFITTATDVLGFLTFLGLATIILG